MLWSASEYKYIYFSSSRTESLSHTQCCSKEVVLAWKPVFLPLKGHCGLYMIMAEMKVVSAKIFVIAIFCWNELYSSSSLGWTREFPASPSLFSCYTVTLRRLRTFSFPGFSMVVICAIQTHFCVRWSQPTYSLHIWVESIPQKFYVQDYWVI